MFVLSLLCCLVYCCWLGLGLISLSLFVVCLLCRCYVVWFIALGWDSASLRVRRDPAVLAKVRLQDNHIGFLMLCIIMKIIMIIIIIIIVMLVIIVIIIVSGARQGASSG